MTMLWKKIISSDISVESVIYRYKIEIKVYLCFFHNGSNYDNSIILEALSNNFKNELSLNCIGSSSENFKTINFKFKGLKSHNKKYI